MKCFYHNDMDGRCAGSIVAQYEKNYNKENFFEVDYMMELPIDRIQENETVYLVDYSFKKDTVWQLEKILEITRNVIWIDHHTSSLNLERELSWVKEIEGVRQDKISGAGLTYMYLMGSEFEDMPYYIQLVSDYDCWIYNYEPDTTHFKLGIETTNYDATDEIWRVLSGTWYDNKPVGIGSSENTFKNILSYGKTIKTFIDQDNEYYLSHFGYESELLGHKCYVVNKKSNSWIFGDKINQYPFVVVWVFTGDKYSYSLFSTNKDVDCSKIAEQLGGGGHKGAAGFSSDKLLVVKK